MQRTHREPEYRSPSGARPDWETEALNLTRPQTLMRPPIDLGWVLSGQLEEADLEAARRATERVLVTLRAWFPEFEWRGQCLERQELPTVRVESVNLLDIGAREQALRHWDFALVVTEADLRTFYKPFAYGVSSRSVATAVLSTARIDPYARHRDLSAEERIERMTTRLHSLTLHVFGHLNGLSHSDDPEDFLYDFNGLDELDRLKDLAPARRSRLRDRLSEVGDLRLEERVDDRERPARFYLRAAWIGRGAIGRAVVEARPWQFPIRLSRLTTAGISTLLVLWITGEAWDLGLSRSPALVLTMSAVALGLTTVFVLVQQRLLISRSPRRLSEQQVVTRVAITLVVLVGMLCTYVLLFALTWLMSHALFSEELLERWAPSLNGDLQPGHRFVFSGFAAALGILIGSLGASFEDNVTVRHIAYVDEET